MPIVQISFGKEAQTLLIYIFSQKWEYLNAVSLMLLLSHIRRRTNRWGGRRIQFLSLFIYRFCMGVSGSRAVGFHLLTRVFCCIIFFKIIWCGSTNTLVVKSYLWKWKNVCIICIYFLNIFPIFSINISCFHVHWLNKCISNGLRTWFSTVDLLPLYHFGMTSPLG